MSAKTARVEEPIVSSAGAKVTVACKIPNGLRLRLFVKRTFTEASLGGTKTEERYVVNDDAPVVIIHGPALPWGMQPSTPIVGGYRFTYNVDKDFFDAWLEQNKDLEAVKNHQIFAYEKPDHIIGEAKEKKDILSGLEPLNTEVKEVRIRGKRVERLADERIPRSVNPNLTELTQLQKDD